jgi:hypothetical protein
MPTKQAARNPHQHPRTGEILIESLHGAPKHADAPDGAIGFRDAAFNITVMASWQDGASG